MRINEQRSLVFSIPRRPSFHKQSPVGNGARLTQLQSLIDYDVAPIGEMDAHRSQLSVSNADVKFLHVQLSLALSGSLDKRTNDTNEHSPNNRIPI